jgi:hypothetical protein
MAPDPNPFKRARLDVPGFKNESDVKSDGSITVLPKMEMNPRLAFTTV